jgi:hypothetical protein
MAEGTNVILDSRVSTKRYQCARQLITASPTSLRKENKQLTWTNPT